jgi:hypothetical protein
MRLIPLAIGAMSMLFLGLVSLQMQLDRTGGQITISGNTGDAYNMSQAILSEGATTLGVSVPGFFLVAIIVFAGVLMWGALS